MDPFDDRWQRKQEQWARKQERWARKQERWAHKMERHHGHHSPMHGTIVGGIVITVGILFLLQNLGIFRFHDLWSYWPVILIVFGFARLINAHGPAAIVWGSIVAGLGALLLANNLDLIRFDWRVVWPVLIIAWGLLMLLRPRRLGPPPSMSGPDFSNPSAGPNLA